MAKVTVSKISQAKASQAEASQDQDFDGTPTAQLILAWAVVSVPLLYGVSQVFVKSLVLFR